LRVFSKIVSNVVYFYFRFVLASFALQILGAIVFTLINNNLIRHSCKCDLLLSIYIQTKRSVNSLFKPSEVFARYQYKIRRDLRLLTTCITRHNLCLNNKQTNTFFVSILYKHSNTHSILYYIQYIQHKILTRQNGRNY
jgi:hypothetical protein